MTSNPSYIDYETFLAPDFSPHSFANTLVLGTNDSSDTTLDLTTPLSRVLFDIQEIDTHIHSLTTKSALEIIEYVRLRDASAALIAEKVSEDVHKLKETYERLQREVLGRYERAEKARIASLRTLECLRIGRGVARALALGRQLEIQLSESGLGIPGKAGKEDHRALVRAVYTVLEFRGLLEREDDSESLQRVNVVRTLKTDLFAPVEERTKSKAQQIIREFGVSSLGSASSSAAPTSTSTSTPRPGTGSAAPSPATPTTFLQTEDAKARTTSAVTMLYLLSPISSPPTIDTFQPTLLLTALQTYLQNAQTASLASLARALSNLSALDRVLLEVSARCQNVVALEILLGGVARPDHPFLPAPPVQSHDDENDEDWSSSDEDTNISNHPQNQDKHLPKPPPSNPQSSSLLFPLLTALDTSSLPSYFWRSLASNLSSRVQEILNRGGASARALRAGRERVGVAVREAVIRGGVVPKGLATGAGGGGGGKLNGDGEGAGSGLGKRTWEREAAVMVGSVVGGLGR